MSYNICHYNFDIGEQGFPKVLLADKSAALKEMLWEIGADFAGLQEDAVYLDAEKTVKAAEELFEPGWIFKGGSSGNTIRARTAPIKGTNKLVKFSTGRSYRQTMFEVNGGRLLFISCHPTAKTGKNEERREEYIELFDGIAAEKWRWCIVTGDFNTTDQEDRENLIEVCRANAFRMAIGGGGRSCLPWVTTYMGHDGKSKLSFDNVLAGGNVDFLRVKVLREWYGRLYSDHVPVVAEVRLRE